MEIHLFQIGEPTESLPVSISLLLNFTISHAHTKKYWF